MKYFFNSTSYVNNSSCFQVCEGNALKVVKQKESNVKDLLRSGSMTVFLDRRAAARYRALASIIPGSERFSWNLSF